MCRSSQNCGRTWKPCGRKRSRATEYVITRYRRGKRTSDAVGTDHRAGLRHGRSYSKIFEHRADGTSRNHFRRTSSAHGWKQSSAVAAKHYLQVTDEHFAKATESTAQKIGTLYNAIGRNRREWGRSNCEIPGEVANSRMPVVFAMGDEGPQHPIETRRKRGFKGQRCSKRCTARSRPAERVALTFASCRRCSTTRALTRCLCSMSPRHDVRREFAVCRRRR